MINPSDKHAFEALLKECMDPNKVVLTCGTHHYVYRTGNKYNKPVFGCKECQMVAFFSLIANLPPEKREEAVEMLEYSVHKLIEAEKRGELQQYVAHRPEVKIDKVN